MAGTGDWRNGVNPFPSIAFARITELRPEVITIKTLAVEQIEVVLDAYLHVAPGGDDRRGSRAEIEGTGRVCMIEGDYGSGKTHLAIKILDRVEEARTRDGLDIHDFYLVAPDGTFLTLYTDLMSRVIGKDEVLARVREFYADIVADSLHDWQFAGALVKQLQRGGVDPQLIVAQYGLRQGALQEQMRLRLRSVTSDEVFSQGLMLLLEPELRDQVWAWLVGGTPGQALLEWGVKTTIGTDVKAMEALGVIARLYGRSNRRLVLVLDEIEHVIMRWDRSDVGTAQAFKTLLEVFHGAGAFLAVCGLPDVFAVLSKETGRIDAYVHPSLFDNDDVRLYVAKTLGRALGTRSLKPFSEDSFDYLVDVTGGLTRDVVRLCYEAYEEALATGDEITPRLIGKVAGRGAPGGGARRARAEISELLAQEGWPAQRQRVLDGSATPVDFWIPVGENGRGVAVVVEDSVFEEGQAAHLAARLRVIVTAAPGREMLLVLVGYLRNELRQQLADALVGGALLVYNPHFPQSFASSFPGTLRAVVNRVGPVRASTPDVLVPAAEILSLRAETDRMARQQGYTLQLVQELVGRTEELSSGLSFIQDLPGRLSQLERSVDELGGKADPPQAGRRKGLPAELEATFGAARRALDAYRDLQAFVDETFEAAAREHGPRLSAVHRLRNPDAFSQMGISAFLSDLLLGFRESVRIWLARVADELAPGAGPSVAQRDQLQGICRAFEALYGAIPMYRFDPLPAASDTASGDQELLTQAAWSARRDTLSAAFDGLGDRVYQAALRAASVPSG